MARNRNRPDDRGGARGPGAIESSRGRKPKAPKQQQPPKKNPLAGVVPTWDPSRGKLDPAGQDPIAKAQAATQPAAMAKRNRERNEIFRRQRLLRALGYHNVVVDGVWGPISQRAWNRYTHGQGRSVFDRDPRNARDIKVTGPTEAQLKADRQKQQQEAERIRVQREQAKQAKIKARADLLRSNPRAARQMTLGNLAEVLRHPTMQMTANRKPASRAIQEFLAGQGRRVKMTGVYDAQTHAAFEDYVKDVDRNEQKARVAAIKRDLYGRAGVKPGDKPSWFPLTDGVPTPEKLDELMQKGGFTAKKTLEALLRKGVTPLDGFNQARNAHLHLVALQLQPFGLDSRFGLQKFGVESGNLLVGSDFLGDMAAIFGVADLAGKKDFSDLSPAQQIFFQQQRANQDSVIQQNMAAIENLHAETMALAESTSREEFDNKLFHYMKVNEQKQRRRMQEAASRSSFWEKPIAAITAPGEFLRTVAVYDVMAASQQISRAFGVDAGERDVIWEDAQVVLGKDPDTIPKYDNLAKSANGMLSLGFNLIADPLNFVAPFRGASTLLRAKTGGQQLGAYALATKPMIVSGEIAARRQIGVGTKVWNSALVYNRGTWSKKAGLASLDDFIFGANPIRDERAWKWVAEKAKKMTQVKQEAYAKVQQRLSHQIRHGFNKPPTPNAAKNYKGKTPKSKPEVDKARARLRKWIEKSPEFEPLLGLLKDKHLSLYVDSDRTTLSNVGASILANWAEKARVSAIHQLATDSIDNILETRGLRSLDQADPLYREGVEAAIAEYANIVNKAGIYIGGGVADKELSAEILARTLSRMDDIEEVLFPVLQDMIQDNADLVFNMAKAAGKQADALRAPVTHPLWDDGELWAGRFGDDAETLRRLGRESFDNEVLAVRPNPSHGIAHTWDEAQSVIEGELRRRLPRIYGNMARNLKAGTISETFDFGAEVERVRREIWDGWQQNAEDGFYYDTRENIETSALYAREHEDSFRAMEERLRRAGDDGTLASQGVARLTDIPIPPSGDLFDDSSWKIMWTLGSRFKTPNPHEAFSHPTRRSFRSDISPDLPPEERLSAIEQEKLRLSEFSNAVKSTKLRLSEAADELMGSEMAREGFYMQALHRAQSKYLRALWHVLDKSMKLWVFATLPLRSGWVVRNVLDNTAKAIINGIRDPRLFFAGAKAPGGVLRAGKSIFEHGLIYDLRGAVRLFDGLFNTDALKAFDAILDQVWEIPTAYMKKLFPAHGLPAPGEAVLEGARFSQQRKLALRGDPNPLRVTASDYEALGEEAPKSLVKSEVRKETKAGAESAMQRFAYKMRYEKRDTLWDLFADRPENYFKRVIYRGTYDKTLRELPESMGQIEKQTLAHEAAWDRVTETLFDYSQITAIEDNLRVFFPFIQFWRKNTNFWIKSLATKPWLDNAIIQFDQQRQESNRDLPAWMQRYIHTDEVVDAAAVVPGLDRVVEAALPGDMMLDPMSFASVAPLYRAYRDAFYGDNELLTPKEKGMKIIGPMLDAMNDFGLGMSPYLRKPLEASGVASSRAWQSMFPQTQLAVALSRTFVEDDIALRLADWERIFTLFQGDPPSEQLAENFDYYVNQEMVGQAARGQEPDRKTAEDTMRGVFILQQTWAYFGGVYWRRATPEDIYMVKLADSVVSGEHDPDTDTAAGAREQKLLNLWWMRKMDPETVDRYIALVPMIEAYYRTASAEGKAEILMENPAIREYVQVRPQRRTMGSRWVQNIQKHSETARYFEALKIIDRVDPDSTVRGAAYDIFASPALRKFWGENDTKVEQRERMVKGEVHRYYRDLNETYHSIPDSDFEAKNGFVDNHPEIVEYWNRHNNPSDDGESILMAANADLREQYFNIVESAPTDDEGFRKAAAFLKRHPFMFEDTRSADKIDEKTGTWKMGGGSGGKGWSKDRTEAFAKAKPYMTWFFDTYMKQVGAEKAWDWLNQAVKDGRPGAILIQNYLTKYSTGGKGWSAERKAAFLEAKPHLTWFFDEFMKRVGEEKAWDWLETSDSPKAKIIKDYLKKYSKQSKASLAYMRASPWLKVFYGMDHEAQQAWLDGDSEGAKIVRWYFDTWAGKNGISQHAKDYLDSKAELQFYFDMEKGERAAWLKSEDPRAAKVLSYFKKYGKNHQYEKFFKAHPELRGGTPEQARRMLFWQQLYALPPDQRPLFVLNNAEEYGVFIYGDFGEQQRHDENMEWQRRAVGLGLNDKQAAFLYVKPLLDFYQTLPDDDKPLFLRANPSLQDYFDKWVTTSATGDPKLDKLVESYFQLPPDSIARSEFLKTHPEVQDWFDDRGSPAEKAMRNLLEQYFAITYGPARKQFAAAHPEISVYFEQRREERARESELVQSFDKADPRLKPYFATAEDLERSAYEMRRRLKIQAMQSLWESAGVSSRRERRPTSLTT